jgi:hypothetical protein
MDVITRARREDEATSEPRLNEHGWVKGAYESPQWKAFVRARQAMRARDEAWLRAFERVDLEVLIALRRRASKVK